MVDDELDVVVRPGAVLAAPWATLVVVVSSVVDEVTAGDDVVGPVADGAVVAVVAVTLDGCPGLDPLSRAGAGVSRARGSTGGDADGSDGVRPGRAALGTHGALAMLAISSAR